MPEENTSVTAMINSQRSCFRYRTAEGYYIIAILPEAEVMQTRDTALYVNTFMEVLVFAAMFALIYMLIKLVVVNQLKRINASLAKITGGDLNEVVNVRTNAEFVEPLMEELDSPMRATIQVNVAIDEIFSNIVRYGYQGTTGPVTVRFLAEESPKQVSLEFSDEGIPYNPLTREDPDVIRSAEEQTVGGLGIYLVKKTMDDVKYQYENGQNILTITKRLE